MGIIEVKRICGECLEEGITTPIYTFTDEGKIVEHNHEEFVKKKAILDTLEKMQEVKNG